MCCLPAEADSARGVAIPQAQKAHYNPFATVANTEQQGKPLKHQGKRIDGEDSSSPFSSACRALMSDCHSCYATVQPVRVSWGRGLHIAAGPIVLLPVVRALRDVMWLSSSVLECLMPLAEVLAGLFASGIRLMQDLWSPQQDLEAPDP